MRVMLHVVLPTPEANEHIRNGRLQSLLNEILDDLKPEAAYFTEHEGCRSAYIFFDMKESSQLPAIAEPWFLAFNATITVRPAMTVADLAAAGPGFERAIRAFGNGVTT